MRRILFIKLLILLTSCSTFQGKIDGRTLAKNDPIVYFFLVNNSRNMRYKFTVKEISSSNIGNKNFRNLFYELEPGEEVKIGQNFNLTEQTYKNEYSISSFDTLKEVTDFGTQIKRVPPKHLKMPTLYVDKTEYFKNREEIHVIEFFQSVSNDAKLIDSIKNGNIEIKTYQVPVKYLSKQIPLPKIKTTYKYEITGEVLLSK